MTAEPMTDGPVADGPLEDVLSAMHRERASITELLLAKNALIRILGCDRVGLGSGQPAGP